ncbi:MAG: hypothetical protein ACK4VY_03945 [Brevundimonas sp.]
MTHRPLLLVVALVLCGCAGLRDPAPPGCDGRSRRPANPDGSVLATGAAPTPSPAPAPPRAGRDPDAASAGGCA